MEQITRVTHIKESHPNIVLVDLISGLITLRRES